MARIEGTQILADLKADLVNGAVITVPAPWLQIPRMNSFRLRAGCPGHRGTGILPAACQVIQKDHGMPISFPVILSVGIWASTFLR